MEVRSEHAAISHLLCFGRGIIKTRLLTSSAGIPMNPQTIQATLNYSFLGK